MILDEIKWTFYSQLQSVSAQDFGRDMEDAVDSSTLKSIISEQK